MARRRDGEHEQARIEAPRRWSKLGIVVLAVACALLGSVLTPAGRAVAAQITNVFVTNDNAHPVPVREQGTPTVNVAGGSLTVDGSVGVNGPVELAGPVEIAGTVRTRPSVEAALSAIVPMNRFNNEEQPLGPFPAGSKIGITALTFYNDLDVSAVYHVGWHQFTDPAATTCPTVLGPDGFVASPIRVPLAPGEQIHLTYPTGLIISPRPVNVPHHQEWCLRVILSPLGITSSAALMHNVITAYMG